jgi:molecular chaperone GrpE
MPKGSKRVRDHPPEESGGPDNELAGQGIESLPPAEAKGDLPAAAGPRAHEGRPAPSGQPDYKDLYLRALAELDNYRKVQARERRALIDQASEGVLAKLLEPVDAFERAVTEVERLQEQAPAAFRPAVQRSVEGMKALERQLQAVLTSEGVECIDPRGEPFDPEHHDAVARVESADQHEGTIIEVVQVGYRLRGTSLRPPRVVVATAPSPLERAPDAAAGKDSDNESETNEV